MRRSRDIAKARRRKSEAKRGAIGAPLVRRASAGQAPVITLLTDFGTSDYFAGAMKGAILSVNPACRIVDLTHEIPPHDIQAGAFTLRAASDPFPPTTIHVAVVDPGVGSSRRPVLVVSSRGSFVGPDNGLFSLIYRRDAPFRVFHVTSARYFRNPVSPTFHGRDIFAPVAAALSAGTSPYDLGRPVNDFVVLDFEDIRSENGRVDAKVINIDRFGNCVTNITGRHLTQQMVELGARLVINGTEISRFRRFFAESESEEGELFAVWGSAGFLEIAAFRDSAARLLGVRRGQSLALIIPSS